MALVASAPRPQPWIPPTATTQNNAEFKTRRGGAENPPVYSPHVPYEP